MTSVSQKIIMAALLAYKRENLRLAKLARDGVLPSYEEALAEFEQRMTTDDAIERALEEIAVAQ